MIENANQTAKQTKKLANLAWPWMVLSLIVGLAIGGAALYFWQSSKLAQKEQAITTLTKKLSQVEDLNTSSSTASQGGASSTQSGQTSVVNHQAIAPTPPAPQPKQKPLSDRQILEMKVLDYYRSSSVAQYWAPQVVLAKDNLHATTSGIPVRYDASNGYYVPGMGGMSLFWHKIQGQWKQVGHCSESGCNMNPGYNEANFPRA